MSAVYKYVVVIAELVTFANDAVGVVEVVLHTRVVHSIRAQRVCVYVVVDVCAQQVFHCLVVASAVCSGRQPCAPLFVGVNLLVQCRGKCQRQRVVVLCLYKVHGIGTLCVYSLICEVQAVPVNLAVAFCCRPVFVLLVPVCKVLLRAVHGVGLIPYVIPAARHVFPVCGVRVVAVVIVKLCALVHAVLAEERCRELSVVVDVPVPCEECRRRKVVDNARVALLAVLISPVRVVILVVGKPQSLVGCRSLCGALGGIAPCRERQRMTASVEHLLHAEEIRQGVVERAFNISFLGSAVCKVGGESPAVVVEA